MKRAALFVLVSVLALSVAAPVASAHDCNQAGSVSWDRNHSQVYPPPPADDLIGGPIPSGHICVSYIG